MAFTNSSESTTDDLASLEKERSARGSRSDPLPLLAIFALGVCVGFAFGRQ
jgi:hypothetical protein